MGCVPTCNTGSLGTEDILEKDPKDENSGSSLTVPVCTFPTTSDFFTEWGRVYEGLSGGCLLDGTKGSCRGNTYGNNIYWTYENNIYASVIKSMDSDGVTSYISGGLDSNPQDDTYFSYTIYHKSQQNEHISEKNTVCQYTAATPKFIVQFPDYRDENDIKYAKCIEIDSCPGTLHEDDQLIDNTPVRCRLTKLEAEANFGLTGKEGWCRGPIYGGYQFCEYKYAIYGWSDDYDISNNPEYFHHCAAQPPKDESGNPESDVVCEKLHPEGHYEVTPLFKCQHISGTISKPYIYPIYIQYISNIYLR